MLGFYPFIWFGFAFCREVNGRPRSALSVCRVFECVRARSGTRVPVGSHVAAQSVTHVTRPGSFHGHHHPPVRRFVVMLFWLVFLLKSKGHVFANDSNLPLHFSHSYNIWILFVFSTFSNENHPAVRSSCQTVLSFDSNGLLWFWLDRSKKGFARGG